MIKINAETYPTGTVSKKFQIRIGGPKLIKHKKSSKSPKVMSLVRKMVLACLESNILLKAEHISGRLNSLADSSSRCDFQKFRRLSPDADQDQYAIPSHLWEI
jgi:hypothetical protein